MGLLGDLLEDAGGVIGEAGRRVRTAKREQANMTPELQQAVERIVQQAEGGDIDAMGRLADAYIEGTQLRYDPDEACRWWTAAAKSGHVTSMYNLGLLYHGDISKHYFSPELAGYWLYEASIRGDRDAKEILERYYKYSNFSQKWKRR